MIKELWEHTNGTIADLAITNLDLIFNYNVRFQVLVQSQEERDYLSAMQLMYGREIQVDIWEEWKKPVPALTLGEDNKLSMGKMQRRLLPIVFTSFQVNLRGL